MKRTAFIIMAVLSLVLLASCSGDKAATAQNKSDAPIDYITVYAADGNLEGYLEFEYDSNGNETTYGMQDTNHAWIWFYVNTYDENGNKTEMAQYDASGNKLISFLYENNDDGKPISQRTIYSDENLMEQSCVYEYEGEKLAKVTHNDGTYYIYEYDKNGNQTSEKYFTSDGTLVRTFKSDYDKNGNNTKTSFVYEDGSIESYSTYEFNNKGEITFGYDYDKNGDLINKMEYHYMEK